MIDDFHRFAANNPDPMATVYADGRIAFANRSFDDLFGGGPAAGGERHMDNLRLSPASKNALREGLSDVLGGGAEKQVELSDSIGGERRRFQCRLIPRAQPAEEGDVLMALRTGAGANGRRPSSKKAAHAVSHTSASGGADGRYFRVLDKFPAFVYLQRPDYKVAYANNKVRDLYGETEARLCYEVFAGRTSPCPVCPTFEVFATGRPIEWEFNDAKGRTFRIYDYPFEDETGEPLVMELGLDVTELKEVEKELFQAKKLRAIGVLAGGLAHDLNNNLVPVIFNIDHALKRVKDQDTRDSLSEAQEAAYRAAKLVEQVLEYSRGRDVGREPLRLGPLIRESLEDFHLASRGGIAFDVDIGNRPDCVLANSGQMRQVIINLLKNAEQAMPDGGTIFVSLAAVEIQPHTAVLYPGLSPGKFVALTVRDTGVGISHEDKERIFEPFFTTKKKRGGSGMGLAVVHAIVVGGGGKIQVESAPGCGTAFTIYLPETSPLPETLMGEYCEIQGRGNRVLFVDDDPGTLSAMARALREAGFQVVTAASGEEGLAEFAKDPPGWGLVLADQSMPGMSGIDMSAEILSLRPEARIVICTGHVEQDVEERAKKVGVCGFAVKPLTPYACPKKSCPSFLLHGA
ncbi:MAG: ATP-binding protein [Desulfosarcinaceae bacterium]